MSILISLQFYIYW